MQEDTCKKIRESLSFEKSGEEVYVEIGMKNVPPKIKTKTVVDFLKTLFEGAIDQLEAPVISDATSKVEEPTYGTATGDAREAATLNEKWAAFATNDILQPGTVCDLRCGGGAPGPAISIPCPPKREEV